jgi:beta-phosphoglucomutase-like phosphatase (HAD superfamily)
LPLIFALFKRENMQLDTVIFAMDGLLVDSEPLWAIAANEVFEEYGFRLSPEQHITTTACAPVNLYIGGLLILVYPKRRKPKGKKKY